MSHLWNSRLEAECLKVAGGGWRSSRMRLWDGFRDERRVAVARPMPEEPPVMRIVLGVLERVLRAEGEGVKSVIVRGFCVDGWL